MIAPPEEDRESVENEPSLYNKNSANVSISNLECEATSKTIAAAVTMRRTASTSGLSGMAVETMSAGNSAVGISNANASIQADENEPRLLSSERKISSLTRTASLSSNQNLSRFQCPLKESFPSRLSAYAALPKKAKIEKRNSTQSLNVLDKNSNTSENVSGRWTAEEHEAFLAGLKIYGREWKKVANCIPTRTSAQIRSHAQKYFAKLSKESQMQKMLVGENRCNSCPGASTATDAVASSDKNPSLSQSGRSMSSSFLEMANTICRDPSALEEKVTKTLAALKERYAQLDAGLKQIQSSSSTYDSPTLEGQQGQLAVKVTPEQLGATAVATTTNAMGPATAALAKEQKSLREAAKARYEMKKLKRQSEREGERSVVAGSNNQSNNTCACVSMSSIPSRGDFDSDEVLALSVLGGTLGRETVSATTIETTSRARTTDRSHQQPTQQQTDENLAEGQENIEYTTRPAKLRKTNNKNEI
ncbi:hypothetical protein ACHAXS_010161 [Conticribra weissflogii]